MAANGIDFLFVAVLEDDMLYKQVYPARRELG